MSIIVSEHWDVLSLHAILGRGRHFYPKGKIRPLYCVQGKKYTFTVSSQQVRAMRRSSSNHSNCQNFAYNKTPYDARKQATAKLDPLDI
eukprot:5072351-Pleurochrysis_carterae.AAC.2